MPFTARIFRLIETELNKHLAFTYTIVKRRSPKGPITVLKVWMRNDTGINLHHVRGAISPGPAANFGLACFSLATLPSREQAVIAEIEARILEPLNNRFSFDRMATIDVQAQADLTAFRCNERDRPLSFVQDAEAERTPLAPGTRTPVGTLRLEPRRKPA